MYRYPQFVQQVALDEFNKLYRPGTRSSRSGIYRCEECGHEAVHTHEKPLPSENHHTHPYGMGPILWRLIVTDYTRSA